ncbi:hypothetical protein [Candidatus Electrothrix sp.]|uniref:hypothetical protein n=1 Tax=Candidatus Electrothrix sp. TaxID=2170559 RepID=UPI004056B3EA
MTPWHRLFGITVIDLFTGSPYRVELEKDLSLKQQFVDVVIIEQEQGEPPADLPDGLDNLGPHNILSFKSHQEPFTPWACDELLGHYVNYRKQASPSMDNLLPSKDFRLYAVAARHPEKLARKVQLHEHAPGVYDFIWGSRSVRLIVTGRVAQTKQNAVWELFSGIPERVAHGAADYEWRTEGLSSVISTLYTHYRLEGIQMPYTVKDYLREVTLDNLDTLTPEERLKGIALKERLKGIPVKDRFHGVSLEEALKYFFLDESEEKKRNILQKLLKEEQKK